MQKLSNEQLIDALKAAGHDRAAEVVAKDAGLTERRGEAGPSEPGEAVRLALRSTQPQPADEGDES